MGTLYRLVVNKDGPNSYFHKGDHVHGEDSNREPAYFGTENLIRFSIAKVIYKLLKIY